MNTARLAGWLLILLPVSIGFLPMTEETYQHVRVWLHALLGASIGIGIGLLSMASIFREKK